MAISSSDASSSGSDRSGLYPSRALRQLMRALRQGDPDAVRRARAVYADLREMPDAQVADHCGRQRCQHIITIERGAQDWTHLQAQTSEPTPQPSTSPAIAWAASVSRGRQPQQWGLIGSCRRAISRDADLQVTSSSATTPARPSRVDQTWIGTGFNWGPVGLNVDDPAISLLVGSPGSGITYAAWAISQAYLAPIAAGPQAPRPAAVIWIVTGPATSHLNVPPEMRIARIRTTPDRLAQRRAQYPDVPIDLLGWTSGDLPSETRWRLEGFAIGSEMDSGIHRVRDQPADTWKDSIAAYLGDAVHDNAQQIMASIETRAARIGCTAMPPPAVAGITVVDVGDDDPVLATEFAADVLLAHLTAGRDPRTTPPLTIVVPDAAKIIEEYNPIEHLMRQLRVLRHRGISLVLGYQDSDIEPPRRVAEIAGYRFLHGVYEQARERLRPLLGLPDAITDSIWKSVRPGAAIVDVVGQSQPFEMAWLPPSALISSQRDMGLIAGSSAPTDNPDTTGAWSQT